MLCIGQTISFLTSMVETSKLVLTKHYDVSVTSRLAKIFRLINCHILLKHFKLIFFQLPLVNVSCKLIVIWVNYEKKSFLWNSAYNRTAASDCRQTQPQKCYLNLKIAINYSCNQPNALTAITLNALGEPSQREVKASSLQ